MNIKELSLRQKVGQLMMVGFTGTEPSEDILRMIEEEHVGGIILFARNIGTPKQVLQLTNELQVRAKKVGHPLPLLISIDQENGVVKRLSEGTTIFPGNMLLGAVDDEQVTRDVAKGTAKELKALGINMNLAPVLDVNNNPLNPVIGVRSFGESVEAVTRHGLASIKGHQEAGVMTSAKHFPGHGDTDTDSHLALPTIPHNLERLEEVELRPFRRAIKAGVDSVMVAHVFFPAFEDRKEISATLSHSVVTGLLRERMGFDGVVITDCLEMEAISKTIGTVEGAIQALKAGADIVLVSHSFYVQKETIERIVKAVQSGELSEHVIDKAVERIQLLKSRYVSWESLPSASIDLSKKVGSTEHIELANHVYTQGVTMLKNDGILPLKLNHEHKVLVVTLRQKVSTPAEDLTYAHYRLADAIHRYHPLVEEFHIDLSPTAEESRKVEDQAQTATVVIFGSLNAHLNTLQADLIKRLLATGKPVVVVAIRNPYDLMVVPDVQAFLATYEFTLPALNVAADIIFGKTIPQGKLPVTLPGTAEKGFGL